MRGRGSEAVPWFILQFSADFFFSYSSSSAKLLPSANFFCVCFKYSFLFSKYHIQKYQLICVFLTLKSDSTTDLLTFPFHLFSAASSPELFLLYITRTMNISSKYRCLFQELKASTRKRVRPIKTRVSYSLEIYREYSLS